MTRKTGHRPVAKKTALDESFARDRHPDRQRIDRWLWHARLVRTRTAAASLASAGYVRLNGARILEPGRRVRLGDVVTVALDRRVRVLRVTGLVERRGDAPSSRLLYEEIE